MTGRGRLGASGWSPVIEGLASDDLIVALAGDVGAGLAVSKLGRVWRIGVDSQTGTRSSYELGSIDPAAAFASFDDGSGYLSGAGALWCVDAAGLRRCDIDAGVQAALVANTVPNQWLLTGAGDVLVRNDATAGLGEATPWCREAHLALSGPAIAVGGAPCGASSNFRILTAQQLVGQDACSLVP